MFFSKGFPGGLKLILFNLFNSSQPSKPLKVCRMLAQKGPLNASEFSIKCGFKTLPQ